MGGSSAAASAPGLERIAPGEQRANMSDSGATILVKLIKAEKLRTNIRGDPPDVMAKFRITGKRFWPNSNALVAL